mgnify:CR=1 FL=1
MNTNELTAASGSVLLAIVVTAIVLQWRTNVELRREVANLRETRRESLALRTDAPRDSGAATSRADGTENRPPPERAELARLYQEINQLKTRTQEIARVVARGAEGAVPLNLLPASAWKNAGKATPSAAAETLMWAADGGDVETLAKSIFLEPAAREKAEGILARLPDSMRATYDTPEKLVALLMAREGDIRAMQVLVENKQGDDALVNLRAQKDDGKTKEEGYQFRRANDGWQMVVPGKLVDKFGKKLTEPPKKGGK